MWKYQVHLQFSGGHLNTYILHTLICEDGDSHVSTDVYLDASSFCSFHFRPLVTMYIQQGILQL